MKLLLKKGVTSQTQLIFIQDKTSTQGAGLAGLAYNTATLTWYYYREAQGTGATAVTLATMTLGTWASGGFVEVDATNMPGWYEIGIPNAALATGADFVGMQLKGAGNMAQLNIEIQLVDVDLADGVRMGLTALPNATAGGAAGVPVVGTGTNNFKSDASANVTYANAAPPTAAAIATGVWQDTTAGDFTVAGSIGKSVMNGVALGTGLTVNDITTKTGYSLTQTFPTNFADLAITVTTGRVTVGTVSDKTGYSLSATGLDAIASSATGVQAIVDGVWDEATAGHATAGTTGKALTDAGSASDPWSTALPGAYGAGTAGKIVGDNINATISSRGTGTALDAAGVRAAVGLASADLDTQIAALPTAVENADTLLDRNMATGTDSGSPTVRTVRQALRFLRNKWSLSGTTLTVTKEDDTTASWTSTVSTDAAAVPVVGNDPA